MTGSPPQSPAAATGALGRYCIAHYQPGFLIDGKPATNIQMQAMLVAHREAAEADADRDGCCCPEGPEDSGACPRGLGTCRDVERAEAILVSMGVTL